MAAFDLVQGFPTGAPTLPPLPSGGAPVTSAGAPPVGSTGLFDIFSNKNAKNAAADQIWGIQQGISSLGDLFNQGRQALTGYTQAGLNSAGDLFGQARDAINSLYGSGANALTQNFTAGLAPFLQNYSNAAQGQTALGNALGLNGPAGNAAATQAFQNNPGYQFQLQQGNNAILAAQAAGLNGGLMSGNTLKALSDYNQGLAGTSWNNYVSNLQPYLGAASNAASGIMSGFGSLGSGLANLFTGQGGILNQNLTGQGGLNASTLSNLGSQLLQNFSNQGNANFGAFTSMGNSLANANLANNNASGNMINGLMGLLGMGAGGAGQASGGSGGGGGGGLAGLGSLASGLGSGFGSAASGIGSGLGSLLGFLSDAKAKEDIEPIGITLDGRQLIHRYRYAGDPRHQIGLIAQEVEQIEPGAVFDFTPELKGVDYKRATDRAASMGSKIIDFARAKEARANEAMPATGNYADGLMRFAA